MTKTVKPHLEAALRAIDAALASRPGSRAGLIPGSDNADALLLRLQIAGEQLSRARTNYPDLFASAAGPNWTDLIAVRNIISHGYASVDYDIVWDILSSGLPQVRRSLHAAIAGT